MKDGLGHGERIPRKLRRKLGGDVPAKFVYLTITDGLSRNAPALVVDATNEDWELSAEMDSLLGR